MTSPQADHHANAEREPHDAVSVAETSATRTARVGTDDASASPPAAASPPGGRSMAVDTQDPGPRLPPRHRTKSDHHPNE